MNELVICYLVFAINIFLVLSVDYCLFKSRFAAILGCLAPVWPVLVVLATGFGLYKLVMNAKDMFLTAIGREGK